jgi:hypothetical protein
MNARSTICALVVATMLACGGGSGDAKPAEPKAEADGDAKPKVSKPAPANTTPYAPMSVQPPRDVCRAFDEKQVASALGWNGINKVSAVGGSTKGVRHRTCSYVGEGNTEQHFGASFSMAKELEPRHAGFGVVFEPRAPIAGHETQVAMNDRVVVLQMMTPDLRVTVDVSESGKTAEELAPKLEAAAIALVGSLSPETTAMLEKK